MFNSTYLKKLTAQAVLFAFVSQTILPMAYAADVIVDASAASNKKPLMDAASNGVPIVHIAAPSAGGVSHNLYQQFNVSTPGLILNNATSSVQTQLGGTIGPNLIMGNTPARIILNEVTSSRVSSLLGKTEIAGSRAEFVLANPNGISCDGCGFINASRASLVTGSPTFSGVNLTGFNVIGGNISVGAKGLNAIGVTELDLISRSLSVNGSVNADNAYVVTGQNRVDYSTLEATANANGTAKPSIAVDIAQLGGMYANQIYLLATEQGVGVNNRGRLEAQAGGLSLDVNGTLTNNGSLKSSNGAVIANATDINNNLGSVQADGLLLMQASQSLRNTAGYIQGDQVRLSAGAELNSEAGMIIAAKDANLSAGGNLNVLAGSIQAGGNISLQAGKDISMSPLDVSSSNTTYGTYTSYVINTAGGWRSSGIFNNVTCGGGIGSNYYMTGWRLNNCTGPQYIAVQIPDGSWKTTATTQNTGSLITAGGNIDLQAKNGKISLESVSINAEDSITAQAQSIGLLGAKDELSKSSYTPIGGGFVYSSSLDQTLIRGGLNAGWDISLLATGDNTITGDAAFNQGKIFITGGKINADKGQLSILATGDIDIAHDVTSHQSYYQYYSKRKGWFSSKTTHTINSSEIGQIEPSLLSANSISIGADRNLNIIASDIIADNAIGLYAGNDLNVLSTGEISHSYNYHQVKKSGIFGSGGFGITIGSQSKTERTTTDSLKQITASISSLNGDIYATAGNQYLQLSSELLTPQGSINIAAKEALIHSNNNTQSVLQSIQTRQSGLTVGVASPLLSAGQTIADVTAASRRTSDPRMQALGMLTAGLTAYNTWGDLTKSGTLSGTTDSITDTASIGISFGVSKTSYESLTQSSLPQESILTAGRDINITATGNNANEQGDISLIGAYANAAGNVSLKANNDISLLAAIGTTTETTKKKSSSASIGISYNVQSGLAATLGASNSRGFSNGWGTTYFPTELTAKQALTIESGRHTLLKGATVSGDSVTANIGTNFSTTGEKGNLTIESPQDASHYIAKETSSGFNISIPLPGSAGVPSLGLSYSNLKLLSDYQSAKQQTAIRAGAGGFDIQVNGHTQLNGGAIASTAPAANNHLTTQTLDFTNLINRENTTGNSTSISLNLSANPNSLYAGSGVGLANINQSSLGNTDAAIAPADINITRPDLQLAYDKKYGDIKRVPLQTALNLTNSSITQNQAQQSQLQQQRNTLNGSASVAGSVAYWQNQVTSLRAQVSAATPRLYRSCSMSGCKMVPQVGIGAYIAQQNYNYFVNQLNIASANLNAVKATLASIPAQLNTLTQQLATLQSTQATQQVAVNAVADAGLAVAAISRDPNTAHKPVNATFDKTKATAELQAGVAITQAFGQAASRTVGNYASQQLKKANDLSRQAKNTTDPAQSQALEKQAADLTKNWQEGGAARLALHAVIGGLTAGDMSGALGAAGSQAVIAQVAAKINAMAIPDLVKSALIQAAGASIGAAIGNVAGNTASGASSALNATANNYLKHDEIDKYWKAVAACSPSNPAACQEQKRLESLSKQRDADLAACQGQISQTCDGLRQQVRHEQALIVLKFGNGSYSNMLSLGTQTQADATLSSADKLEGTLQGMASWIGTLASGAQTAIVAGFGRDGSPAQQQALQDIINTYSSVYAALSNPKLLAQVLNALNPVQRERIAAAYESGDALELGRAGGEALSMLVGVGAIKSVGNVADAVKIAGNAANSADDVGQAIKAVGARTTLSRFDGPVFKTTKEATVAAESMGYQRTNGIVNGQAVYYNSKTGLYISRDIDGHNGGAWKGASSVEDLRSKATRTGTYDVQMNKIGS